MAQQKKKISKSLKKLLTAFTTSVILVFAIIFLSDNKFSPIPPVAYAVTKIENMFYDSYFKWASANETIVPEQNIFIVDIDETALNKFGPYNTWSRSIHADVVQSLAAGGASAILFDILFKTADFGNSQTDKTLDILKQVDTKTNFDTLKYRLKNFFNDDSLLVESVLKSQNVVVCNLFDNRDAYKHQTLWEPLSTPERQKKIGLKSALPITLADKPENIESKDLLDNIFPELAHAGVGMGSVNAYSDEDGVIRKISLFHKFPNKELYPDAEEMLYPSLALAGIMHLFKTHKDEIKIRLGNYIDVGKPFALLKDSSGFYSTTYPYFTFPMFLALHEKLQKFKNLEDKTTQQNFIQVASKVIVSKEEDAWTVELFDGQIITNPLAEILFHLTNKDLKNATEQQIYFNDSTVVLSKAKENLWNLTDKIAEEEVLITPYIVSVFEYFKDSVPKIKNGEIVHLSSDLDISYLLKEKQWKSNFIILSDVVLRDIRSTPLDTLYKIKSEYRFGKNIKIPINEYGQFNITYGSRFNVDPSKRSFSHLSYYDVAKKRLDPGMYEGKIFILGSATPALFDFVTAPHEENYPGVLVHASILENILHGKFLKFLEPNKQILILIFLALISMLLGIYAKNKIVFISIPVLIFIYLVFGYFAFLSYLYLGFAKPVLIIFITSFVSLFIKIYYESRTKQFLNDAFKQYISPELIQEMLDNEIQPTLGGVKSELTAYFTDIAGFSTFSEKIGDPSLLVELLNEYLTCMTDTLILNKGTLDKYEGDAIIAFFGAPMPLKNHAQNACETAIQMQANLMQLRKKWIFEKEKWPDVVKEMHMRIGINSGDIVTGNMGSLIRKNYTMMGDNVNLAARLESAAKQYGAYIHVSESTIEKLIPGTFLYRILDDICVVGKSKPVRTYELLAKDDNSPESASLKELILLFEKAREEYVKMNFDKAIQLFEKALPLEPHLKAKDPGAKITPSEVYIERCKAYQKNPPVKPGEIWDGVFIATSK